jgi:CelD/BcsL family acetyltransferase involved in cellulose biosynthesis
MTILTQQLLPKFSDAFYEKARHRHAGLIARIEILQCPEQAARYWREMTAAAATASPYQSHDWVRLWCNHVSGPAGQRACIVIGFDADDTAQFLWPLLVKEVGVGKVATSFGEKHATLNAMPWRPEAASAVTEVEMRAILSMIARQIPDLDLLILQNQPESWNGTVNPFLQLPHQKAAEDNFLLRLDIAGPEGTSSLPASTGKRLRHLERKLARLDGYRYFKAENAGDVERLLSVFFAQKAEKLADHGLEDVFARPGIQNFIRAACLNGLSEGRPLIELHALEGEDEILALISGLHDGSRFTCAFTSHSTGKHARYSPSLVLIRNLIADCAGRGLQYFDLGPGAAPFKSTFCKEKEPIFDSVLPLSSRGRLLAPALRALFAVKARIKRNPQLLRLVSSGRAFLRKPRRRKQDHILET